MDSNGWLVLRSSALETEYLPGSLGRLRYHWNDVLLFCKVGGTAELPAKMDSIVAMVQEFPRSATRSVFT